MTTLVIRAYRDAAVPRHKYQNQRSRQTLAEGLEEYYQANIGIVTRPATLAAASSATLFNSHDICHVIFGLDTTLADEALADVRTVFCTDVGLRFYLQSVRDPMAMAVFKELGMWRAITVPLRSLPRTLRAIFERRHQSKVWPWRTPSDFYQRTLAELRDEFGIRVI